jgi:hypothetical protein
MSETPNRGTSLPPASSLEIAEQECQDAQVLRLLRIMPCLIMLLNQKTASAFSFPSTGDYDIWAIKWGYFFSDAQKLEVEEKAYLNEMTKEAYKNPSLMAWFRNKSYDPRYQTGSTLLCVRCI